MRKSSNEKVRVMTMICGAYVQNDKLVDIFSGHNDIVAHVLAS